MDNLQTTRAKLWHGVISPSRYVPKLGNTFPGVSSNSAFLTAYNPNLPPPPSYQPPEGASKVDPSQYRHSQHSAAGTARQESGVTARPSTEEYAPPPGPPPALQNQSTGGSTNPFRR